MGSWEEREIKWESKGMEIATNMTYPEMGSIATNWYKYNFHFYWSLTLSLVRSWLSAHNLLPLLLVSWFITKRIEVSSDHVQEGITCYWILISLRIWTMACNREFYLHIVLWILSFRWTLKETLISLVGLESILGFVVATCK